MIYDKLCDGLNASYITSIFKFEIARFCHFKFVLVSFQTYGIWFFLKLNDEINNSTLLQLIHLDFKKVVSYMFLED